ncbi:hypothetical protein DFH27DRAFT_99713 [Peziza echinospora]|nr:hypothetical protein DFH27DRAFT_99713 [Peziza echinospora]
MSSPPLHPLLFVCMRAIDHDIVLCKFFDHWVPSHIYILELEFLSFANCKYIPCIWSLYLLFSSSLPLLFMQHFLFCRWFGACLNAVFPFSLISIISVFFFSLFRSPVVISYCISAISISIYYTYT